MTKSEGTMGYDIYCVFYMPDYGRGIVSITRVLYGGRDIEDALTCGEEYDAF